VENHIKNECSDSKVDCPYKSYGCDDEIRRRELNEHFKKKAEDHNVLVLHFLDSFQTNYTARLNQLEGGIKMINEKLERFDDDYEPVKKGKRRLISNANANSNLIIEEDIPTPSRKGKVAHVGNGHSDKHSSEKKHSGEKKEKDEINDYALLYETTKPVEVSLDKTNSVFDTKQISKGLSVNGNRLFCNSVQKNVHMFAFVDRKPATSMKWKVTIHNLGNWIAIGMCDKDKVMKNDLKFNSNAGSGHGTFVFTSNGFTFNAKNLKEKQAKY